MNSSILWSGLIDFRWRGTKSLRKSNGSENWRSPRRWRVLGNLCPLFLIMLTAYRSGGQTNDVVSREVSVFNVGIPASTIEAISQEMSVLNVGVPTANVEAISREVSVFNLGIPSSPVEAISREVSVYNQGAQYLVLTLGSTVLRAGDTGSVPVTLFSLASITNVQFTVDFPANRLTNWDAQPLNSASCYASVTNGCQLCVTFNPTNGQTFVNTQQLGQITFTAASNQPSAFLPLCISNAAGPLLQGGLTLDKRFHNGEAVVIHNNPLLRASSNTNATAGYSFTLYGLPGTNYTIEATTNLTPPVTWWLVGSMTLTNFTWSIGDMNMTNTAMFYRARQ